MSKKKHSPHPPPPGNRTSVGPGATNPVEQEPDTGEPTNARAGFSEQDPQRRLGNFETAGEHAIQQPGGKNDA